jgi:hypothetical protein
VNLEIVHGPDEVRARDLRHLARLAWAVGLSTFALTAVLTAKGTSVPAVSAKFGALVVAAGLTRLPRLRRPRAMKGRVTLDDEGMTIDDRFLLRDAERVPAHVRAVYVGEPPPMPGVKPLRLNPGGRPPNVTVVLDRPVRLSSVRGRPVAAGHAPLSRHRASSVVQAYVSDAAGVRSQAADAGWLDEGETVAHEVSSGLLAGHRWAYPARVAAVCAHPDRVPRASAVELSPGDVRPQLSALLGPQATPAAHDQAVVAVTRDVPVPGAVPLSGLVAAAERSDPDTGIDEVALAFETADSARAGAADVVRARCTSEPNPLALGVRGAVGLRDVWHTWGPTRTQVDEHVSESAVLWRGRVVEVVVGPDIAKFVRQLP